MMEITNDCKEKLEAVSKEDNHHEIKEGTASMLYNDDEVVFYNKVQVLNRDLSIQVIRLFSEIITNERLEKYNVKHAHYEEILSKGAIGKAPHPPRQGVTVLDALAATGLRSIRYVKEIPLLSNVTINDLLLEATQAAKANCIHNNVDESKYTICNRDAIMLMYENREHEHNFDVVDLDPYGTAAPFLDSAVQAVSSDGGLLCVTCTDMTVLSGNYPEVCFAKYGSMPLKGAKYLHELSLRILLNSIENAANKYKRHIVPWLSLSVDFYVRVFVRVYESPAEVKNTCLKRMMVYQSIQCASFYIHPLASRNKTKKQLMNNNNSNNNNNNKQQKKHNKKVKNDANNNDNFIEIQQDDVIEDNNEGKMIQKNDDKNGNYQTNIVRCPSICPETNGQFKLGGPFWGEAIHSQVVVDEILRRLESGSSSDLPYPVPTSTRLIGILTSISEELKDVPLYYSLPHLSSLVQSKMPTKIEIHSAIINAGYRVSQFHHDSTALKTDAPPHVIWDILRAYNKLHAEDISDQKNEKSIISKQILSNPSTIIPDFTIVKELLHINKKKVSRFPPNP
eukprot:gene7247-9879_t